MFGMIATIGVGILGTCLRSQRNILIVAASVGLATAVNFAPPVVYEAVTPSLRILAADGIVVGTIAAVLLNLLLPAELSMPASVPVDADP